MHESSQPTAPPIQLAPLEDTSPRLDTEGTTRVQQIVGTLLYYARAVDSTMLVSLGRVGAKEKMAPDAAASFGLGQIGGVAMDVECMDRANLRRPHPTRTS